MTYFWAPARAKCANGRQSRTKVVIRGGWSDEVCGLTPVQGWSGGMLILNDRTQAGSSAGSMYRLLHRHGLSHCSEGGGHMTQNIAVMRQLHIVRLDDHSRIASSCER